MADSPAQLLKVPPHSLEAEQAILGALMLDNEAWDKVSELLKETDFYLNKNRLIFKQITQLAVQQKPFDVLTLSEELKQRNQLQQIGGESYLFELAQNTPSTSNVSAYAEIVRERSVLRQLLAAANNIADSAFNPDGRSVDELLDNAESQVFKVAEEGTSDGGPESVQTVLKKTVDKIETLSRSDSDITGLATGFKDLDKMTSGLQPADLFIVAGRPSMGKTVLGINLVEHVAISKKLPVLVFSLEMPSDAIVLRLISSLARINQQNLRTGQLSDDDWNRIPQAVAFLSDTKLFIDDTAGISPVEMRARARRIAREHGSLGLIMVDYLQLMSIAGSNENRTTQVSEISRSLKLLAREMNCPVVALSQLSRALEQRPDKRPIMADLRESGAIEQDADVIAFIYRDEVYNPESPAKGTAEIIIGKQRNGPIGTVRLTFLGQYTKFEDYTPNDYGAYANNQAG